MKTWEMIKELTENPEKKFESTKFNSRFIAYRSGPGSLVVEDCSSGVIQSSWDLDREWEEVKEPVDFITAIESGYKVRVEHEFIQEPYEKDQFSNHYKYLTELFQLFGSAWDVDDVRKIILEGKWYIED